MFQSKAAKLLSLTSTVACALLLVASRANASDVQTDYDHKAHFSSYHTFSIYKVQTPDPFFEDRIKSQIVSDLTAKGMQLIDSGGDLSVTAIESTKDTQEYNTFYDGLGGGGFGWGGWRGWGGGWGGGMGDATTSVSTIPVGTLLIDLYDRKSHQLVWRGRSHEDMSSKAEKNTSQLDKEIQQMFKKYPPK